MLRNEKKKRLVWVDLEMTGLAPGSDEILEAGIVITTSNLSILAESRNYVIRQNIQTLMAMDNWNTRQHKSSGLWEEVCSSTLNYKQVEQELLAFVLTYVDQRTSPMCGNSICQDRRFLARHMPNLEAFFHYRNLDVSSIKEIAARWNPSLVPSKKDGVHRVMNDIHDSIKELQHYRNSFFICSEQSTHTYVLTRLQDS